MNLIPYVFILHADWWRTWFGSHVNRDVPALLILVVLFTHIKVCVGDFLVLGFLEIFGGVFCSRGREEQQDPEASGYESCSNILQHWLFHGFMLTYFFSD